jgi:hypothetical protein
LAAAGFDADILSSFTVNQCGGERTCSPTAAPTAAPVPPGPELAASVGAERQTFWYYVPDDIKAYLAASAAAGNGALITEPTSLALIAFNSKRCMTRAIVLNHVFNNSANVTPADLRLLESLPNWHGTAVGISLGENDTSVAHPDLGDVLFDRSSRAVGYSAPTVYGSIYSVDAVLTPSRTGGDGRSTASSRFTRDMLLIVFLMCVPTVLAVLLVYFCSTRRRASNTEADGDDADDDETIHGAAGLDESSILADSTFEEPTFSTVHGTDGDGWSRRSLGSSTSAMLQQSERDARQGLHTDNAMDNWRSESQVLPGRVDQTASGHTFGPHSPLHDTIRPTRDRSSRRRPSTTITPTRAGESFGFDEAPLPPLKSAFFPASTSTSDDTWHAPRRQPARPVGGSNDFIKWVDRKTNPASPERMHHRPIAPRVTEPLRQTFAEERDQRVFLRRQELERQRQKLESMPSGTGSLESTGGATSPRRTALSTSSSDDLTRSTLAAKRQQRANDRLSWLDQRRASPSVTED